MTFVQIIGRTHYAIVSQRASICQYHIYATSALHAAAVEADLRARVELAKGLEQTLSRKNREAAPMIAGATLLALDIAIDRWQREKAKKSLGDLITETFAMLNDLPTIT